jgi:hypothetical protein
MRHSERTLIAVIAGGLLVGSLAACSSGGNATPTATATVTKTATASSSPSSSAPASSAPSPSSTGGGTNAGGDTGGASTDGMCTVDHLKGGVAAGSGGAAGSTYIHLTFTNTGTSSCTLQGWPGVSFVGSNNGSQIGDAATFDRSSAHPTVTLQSGQVAVASLKIAQAANFPADQCSARTADGFRVYPPGSKASLFIRDEDFQACENMHAGQLNVQAIVPEGQATT